MLGLGYVVAAGLLAIGIAPGTWFTIQLAEIALLAPVDLAIAADQLAILVAVTLPLPFCALP